MIEILDLTASIIWLGCALGVFTAIVLFALSPMYAMWAENKYHIDLESELYKQITEAVEEAVAEGHTINVQITIGGSKSEEPEEEEVC